MADLRFHFLIKAQWFQKQHTIETSNRYNDIQSKQSSNTSLMGNSKNWFFPSQLKSFGQLDIQ